MIILVHAYTHGGWVHRQRVSTTFLTWKNSQICSCAPDGIRTSVLKLDLEADALPLPTEPPRRPHTPYNIKLLFLFVEFLLFLVVVVSCPNKNKSEPYKRFQSQGQLQGHPNKHEHMPCISLPSCQI